MSTLETTREILAPIPYATLATTADSSPWNTPVFYAHDGDLNIYWSSSPRSVHSANIQTNGKVFMVIYDSTAREGEGVGVYIEASASVVEDEDEIRRALDLLGARRKRRFEHPEKFLGNGPQRIYRATPIRIWTNDADQDADGDFIRDYRVQVDI